MKNFMQSNLGYLCEGERVIYETHAVLYQFSFYKTHDTKSIKIVLQKLYI